MGPPRFQRRGHPRSPAREEPAHPPSSRSVDGDGHHHVLPSDLPPSWFGYHLGGLRVCSFGRCCTPAGQGPHRFGLAVRSRGSRSSPATSLPEQRGVGPPTCLAADGRWKTSSTPSPVCDHPSKNPTPPQRSPIAGVPSLPTFTDTASDTRSRARPPDAARPQGFVPRRRPGPGSALPPCAPSPLLPWASGPPPRSTLEPTLWLVRSPSSRSASAVRPETLGSAVGAGSRLLAVARPHLPRCGDGHRSPAPRHPLGCVGGPGPCPPLDPAVRAVRGTEVPVWPGAVCPACSAQVVRRRVLRDLLGVSDVKERV